MAAAVTPPRLQSVTAFDYRTQLCTPPKPLTTHHTIPPTAPPTLTPPRTGSVVEMGAGASLVSNLAGSGTDIAIPKIVDWLR